MRNRSHQKSWCEALSSRAQVSEIRGSSNIKGVYPRKSIWCEAFSSRAHVSEIRVSSRSNEESFGNPNSHRQIVSKWQNLDTVIFVDVDSNCVHPGFWIRSHMVTIGYDFDRILRILRNWISWNLVLCNLVVSNIILRDSQCFIKIACMTCFIFNNID